MANIYRNISVRRLAGGAGDRSSCHKTRSGKIIAAEKAGVDDDRRYRGTGQAHPAAIGQAADYAHFAATQAVYLGQEAATGISAYYLAIADWIGAPKVLEINVDAWTGKPGQTIRVKARDNVMVAAVSIVIRDAEGETLEMGEAVQSAAGSPWWNYVTRSHVRMEPFPSVEAIARDLPGNQDSFLIN